MENLSAFNLIEHSSLIVDLSTEQCELLSEICSVQAIKNGETLIDQGDTDDSLHIVGEGNLAVERNSNDGECITLHILKPGDLAGEMGFIDGTEHTASLRALGDTTVVSLKRQDMEAVLKSHPGLVYGVMRGVIRSIHQLMRNMNLQHVELNNYISKSHGRY